MYSTDRIEGRKRLRLAEPDYRMIGYYYITLCTQIENACLEK